jgi:hypothetical protein
MKLFQKQLVTGLIIMTGATCAQATTTAVPVSLAPVHVPLVFAQTYVSAGAAATFGGHIVATTYFVGGASNTIDGDIKAGAAITLGADNRDPSTCSPNCFTVTGNTVSGTATTLGAGVKVEGDVDFGTALTRGAGASSYTENTPEYPAPAVHSYNSGQVKSAKDLMSGLDDDPAPAETADPDWVTNHLNSRMDADTTLNPTSGDSDNMHGVNVQLEQRPTKVFYTAPNTVVYNLASLTTAARITLTLTCGVNYVFDIADMLSLGAGSKIEMTDPTTCSNTVTWNVGGYASVGEKAEMFGTVLAKDYISTGVDSVIKGNLHSQTSYVTIGASGTVNP